MSYPCCRLAEWRAKEALYKTWSDSNYVYTKQQVKAWVKWWRECWAEIYFGYFWERVDREVTENH
jgi:hypothetical protein